jgi:hypothetical protein
MNTEEIIALKRQSQLAEYVGDINDEFSIIPETCSSEVKGILLQLVMSSGDLKGIQPLPTTTVNELTDLCNFISPQNEFIGVWHFIVMAPFFDTLQHYVPLDVSQKLQEYALVFGQGTITTDWMDSTLLDVIPRYVECMPDMSGIMESKNDITIQFMSRMIQHQISKGVFKFPSIYKPSHVPKSYESLVKIILNSHYTHAHGKRLGTNIWDISSFVEGFSKYTLSSGNSCELNRINVTLLQKNKWIEIVTGDLFDDKMPLKLYGIRNGIPIKLAEWDNEAVCASCTQYSIQGRINSGCGCSIYNLNSAGYDIWSFSSCITKEDGKLKLYIECDYKLIEKWDDYQRYIMP